MKLNDQPETGKKNSSSRLHFDFKSLRFKLWAYFLLFAIAIIIILWSLQVALLQPYYQHMKTKEIINTGNQLTKEMSILASVEDYVHLIETINTTTSDLNMEILLYTPYGGWKFSGPTFGGPPNRQSQDSADYQVFVREQILLELDSRLGSDPLGVTTFRVESPNGKNDTMVYGRVVKISPDSEGVLVIMSPLTPMGSTINILASQLVYITVFALFTAFLLALWLSKRITRPLVKIKNSAAKLAKGQYGVTFDGGHYTEIVALADTLTYTSQELAKSDNLQKDLIANVTHDLRTPLTMVKSYAEMIRDLSGDNPEKREQHLQVIIDEADRLNTLVTDLLALSKIQSGVDEAAMTTFDLKDMAESLLKAYWILEEQEGYHFEFHSSPDEPIYVRGDENKLKQVLSNLINNAVRYSGEAKQVSVALAVENDTVKCSITDLGPGIPKDELEHIWQRYYRASSTARRSSSGSGLGLAIVKEILTHHHARFGVNSQVDVGSTFWFELPVAAAPNPAEAEK